MPGRNGTGPVGQGPLTGRGMGPCGGVNAGGCGWGMGFGRRRGGFFSGFSSGDPLATKTQEELLKEQKELLQARIDEIDKQLNK